MKEADNQYYLRKKEHPMFDDIHRVYDAMINYQQTIPKYVDPRNARSGKRDFIKKKELNKARDRYFGQNFIH